MSGEVYPLKGNQALAVDPADSVWLSASAGTGKTQVLSARVLRLLLQDDVRPEQILCLTFTKAGAAEMATRVNEVLAKWVRLGDTLLARDLMAIGAAPDPATIARARTLFASVLDCPGGGLRIDTIHAFAQWLLAAFPQEAGIEPGTQPMEDRDRALLERKVLAGLLEDWQQTGDAKAIAALENLSVRLGPDDARAWLMRCAQARDTWFGKGAWQPPMRGRVATLLGLREGESRADLVVWCTDEQFDLAALRQVADAYRAWGTPSSGKFWGSIETWIGNAPEQRLETCASLIADLFNGKDELKYRRNIEKQDPTIGQVASDLLASLRAIQSRKALFDLVDFVTPALEIGRLFALAWEEAKQRQGLVEFDDLIRRAALVLTEPGLGEWIAYKLDRRFDHILIDEAQDTNPLQWSIVRELTGDFFTGEGQHDGKLRTIFAVGDYKQAIFGFQGTSPENFTTARNDYAREMAERATNARRMADELREPDPDLRELQQYELGRSYRTAQDVLDVVNEAIAAIGPASFGLEKAPDRHEGDTRRPGLVTLWEPVPASPADDDTDSDDPMEWLSEPERRMADRIAAQVKRWLDEGYPLVKGERRNATPGDIMVLVRRRKALAGLIVARLHTAGVPVAGVDRLRLGAPLAVKDLMAAMRFAAQPLDDLSLASLLVSPIFGWSQQQLLDHGYRPARRRLWDHLRRSAEPEVMAVAEQLRGLLRLADFEPPQALLHWMLVGPWQARRKLTARLGREAADPIDELLNAALAFSASHTPSLQGFIRWFDAGDGELKRDPDSAGGLVRVMTVHGSKGLQAPIVILADATGNPDTSRAGALELEEEVMGKVVRKLPLPPPRKAERIDRIEQAQELAREAERKEHWRLLYVAMTRAEEALFIGGALGKREEEPAADSWYARLAPLFGGKVMDDAIWGTRYERGQRPPAIARTEKSGGPEPARVELPAWVRTPIGEEPRPPRPLAPSSAGDDPGADPPLPPGIAAAAARRGVLIHALLERLPDIPPLMRADQARQWLERQASDIDQAQREDMVARALAVIAAPDWAELFSPAALAEVPLAATVGGQVIAGTADRLLVEPGRVLVADFKTARRPPASLDAVPLATLRQMGAYAAALETIFPGRTVEAAVLYTQTPQLIAVPAEILAAHRPGLETA